MATEIKTQEKVDGEIATPAMGEQATMEFRLINPTEDGFLRAIKWNREELEAAIKAKVAAYENVVYTEDNLKQAKLDRAELNKLKKTIDDRRKMVKKKVNEPYELFEKELKEILASIEKQVNIIDMQVKEFEDQQKEEKRKQIEDAYQEVIGDLAEILPFERVFDPKYLNQAFKLLKAQQDVKSKVHQVKTDLETIDSLESKYKLNAKDVYIKTLDLSKALAENKRLSDLEEKLEAEKKRKAEEEAERQRRAEELRKAEEERLAAEKEHQENIAEQTENVSKPVENATNKAEIVSDVRKNVADDTSAVDVFAPKPEEKKFKTRFCAVGTKEQLNGLVEYMKNNDIEFGRI